MRSPDARQVAEQIENELMTDCSLPRNVVARIEPIIARALAEATATAEAERDKVIAECHALSGVLDAAIEDYNQERTRAATAEAERDAALAKLQEPDVYLRKALAERDEWKRRAEDAEGRIANALA